MQLHEMSSTKILQGQSQSIQYITNDAFLPAPCNNPKRSLEDLQFNNLKRDHNKRSTL
jgi:hypothetical protein